jgi:hypothetical protein
VAQSSQNRFFHDQLVFTALHQGRRTRPRPLIANLRQLTAIGGRPGQSGIELLGASQWQGELMNRCALEGVNAIIAVS